MTPSRGTLSPDSRFKTVIAIAIALLLFRAGMQAPSVLQSFGTGDNDDMMRLMSVRAWLAGQSWFDMTQYRILPPDGLPMHWSRYVDFGIAAIIVPLSLVFPMPVAEQITLVLWPTLLLAAMIVLIASGTRRIVGEVAAYGAVASLILWLPTGRVYFGVGKLDHHSVQILMATVLAFAMVLPGRALTRGIIAGIAAGFSLAVGLEAVPFIMAAGILMVLRATFGRQSANPLLAGFCLAMTGSAFLFFGGQTPTSRWFVAECDSLASPMLAITVVAAMASLIPMAARSWLPNPWLRLLATLAVALAGLAVCAPLLLPCLHGPYGALPPEVQDIITSRIAEAMPGMVFAIKKPFSFNAILTPIISAALMGAAFWAFRRRKPETPTRQTDAVGQMLLLLCVGLIGSLSQIRMVVLAAPVLAFVAGYALQCLFDRRQALKTPGSTLLLVAGILVMLLAPQLNLPARALVNAWKGHDALTSLDTPPRDNRCRDTATLSALDTLPKARILTSLDLGAPLILSTHHDALTAPYHRSADAYWNGTLGIETDENMQAVLSRTDADYLLLCRGTKYGGSTEFLTGLQRGVKVPWLEQTAFESNDLMVFKVIHEALKK